MVILLIQVLCFLLECLSFFLFYFKDLFLQEGSFNLARQRQVQECLLFLQSSRVPSRSTRLTHTLSLALGPRAWWKITGMWTKDRNGPDLEPRGEVPSCPSAGPAYPQPPPYTAAPPYPPTLPRMPPTALDSSFLQEVASAKLPPSGLPHPTPP